MLDETAARPFVQCAVQLGIDFFDTADTYFNGPSEIITGRLLKEFAKREEVVIVTEVFFPVTASPVTGARMRTIPPRRAPERMRSHSVTTITKPIIVDALTGAAQAKGISNAQVAYAWLLHKGLTALTVGASKLPQPEDAVAATETRLSAEEIASLDAAYKPHPAIGHS